MKEVLMLSTILLLFTASAFSALTPEDIETLRKLIREDTRAIVKAEVAAAEQRIREDTRAIVKEEVAAAEQRLKEYVDIKIDTVNAKIDGVNERLSIEMKGVDKRLDFMGAMVIALVAALIAVVGVPLALLLKRQRAEEHAHRAQDEKLETLWQEREARQHECIIKPQQR